MTNPRTVLLVEDDEDTRFVYRLVLEREGFRVLTATTGREGITFAIQDQPDVILMDLSIPEVDGWTATRRLKEHPRTRDIPVVVVTAHAFPEDRAMASDVSCAGFLVKPCAPRVILDEIQRLVSA